MGTNHAPDDVEEGKGYGVGDFWLGVCVSSQPFFAR